MRYRVSENIRIEQHDDADDGTERHRIPGHESKNDSLIAYLLSGRRGNYDGLPVFHFPHHSPGAIGGAHQNRIDAELLRSDPLQTAKQRIGRSVAARARYAPPAQKRAEERIQPARSRKS